MEEVIFNSIPSELNQSSDYLERPRLHALLKDAINYPLVVVCAGSGYGKTQAVHSFLRGYDAYTTWLQVSERDNIATRFWESYTSQVSLEWPKAGTHLKEIEFPRTHEALLKYTTIRHEVISQPGKHIRVLDDFHLLHNPEVLRFFEHSMSLPPSNMTLIMISRTMPKINLIGLIMKGRVSAIDEDALRFTEDEITKYFNQLKLPVTRDDIQNIYDDTQGWAFAINLIGRSLAKERKYERYALEAMKKNIFRLIESEISQTVSGRLLRFLLRISLITHLTASLIKVLARDDELIREMESVNAYIRYDYNQDMYMIHHLFLDYLKQKQDQILTNEERKETYGTAAKWCEVNGYHMDALTYYEKSGDYDAVTRMVASLNVHIPQDMAQYALDILDRAPEEMKSQNILYPSMYIKLKVNLGQFDEASVFAEKYVKIYAERPETPERNHAIASIFAAWAVLSLKMCTYNDVYVFDIYYKKMSEYFYKSPFKIIGAFTTMSSSAWASHVGTNRPGAMEEYIGAVSRSIPDVSRVFNGLYTGFDDLVRGELCFYRGEFNDAVQHLKKSVDKARTRDQYVTQNRALVYLMQIDFFHGDFASATAKLKEMEALLNEKDYSVRSAMYDIACGFYNLALEQPEQIPEWLKSDFSPYTHPSFLENYANRIKAIYHYQTRQYSTLLAYIDNEIKRETILFDKIEMKVLQSISRNQFKQRGKAIAALTEAYNWAESNNIITSFTEHAKDMRTLSAAAVKDYTCQIPKKWLEDINRKSSSYAKRKSKMISEYRQANNLKDAVKMTNREIAILKDLADGLSRTEIASSHNISINTVKIAVNIIYDKLDVTSLPEAIRAAIERKII